MSAPERGRARRVGDKCLCEGLALLVPEVTMRFALQCILMHLAMLGYFWLAAWYAADQKLSLPPWGQVLVGLASLVILLGFLLRIDLVVLSRSTGGSHSPLAAPAWLFFLRTLAYYVAVLGMPAALVAYKDELPSFLCAYIAFVFFSVLVNHVDYAFPSYGRYRRLVGEGRWSVMRSARTSSGL